MKELLRDSRVVRLLVANSLGSIGSGITIFSVPWLLVNQPGGSEAFRHITIATTILLFLIMPWYGAKIDRSSRRAMVLFSELFGAAATLSMALLGLALGGFGTAQLMAIYLLGMLYYTLHYPAKWAMVQQIFDRSQYQSLTGLMEVQGQAAMLLAGALGGVAVSHLPLWVILLIDCGTYLAAFVIERGIPHEATHLKPAAPSAAAAGPDPQRGGVLGGVAEGWRWLAERPALGVFLTASLLPFIVVMAGNYLVPVYVSETLRAGPGTFALSEVAFAVGALGAGLLLPRLLARQTVGTLLPLIMAIFLVGLILQATLPFTAVFVGAMVLLGFGNAGTRVGRSALMLHVVPNAVMGRVTVFFSVLDRVMRTLLVSSMVVVDVWGAQAGFIVLLAVVAVGLAAAWLSRSRLPAVPA
ncbi:MAG: MFS transporter [Verrucomicrobia bacterium]|nr:MFS transporter [Verrucomicrobiota bacterium]